MNNPHAAGPTATSPDLAEALPTTVTTARAAPPDTTAATRPARKRAARHGDAWPVLQAAAQAAVVSKRTVAAKAATRSEAAKPARADEVGKVTKAANPVKAPAAAGASAAKPDDVKPKIKAVAKRAAKSAGEPASKSADRARGKPAPASPPVSKTTQPAKPAAMPGKPNHAKEKLVRDSFTMPRVDFALIQQLKERALGFKRPTRKSELLRAGLQALAAMGDAPLQALLDKLPALKAGRPKKGD